MVLYTALAAVFLWLSPGSVVCGWFGFFFGLIAFREWDACITGRDFYY